ncbi:MAG: hypothetical protein JST00_22350 [Deltaproteobacteria bacterium]|nr:hypothetical protein [Deltaproteobacteria bacterium]
MRRWLLSAGVVLSAACVLPSKTIDDSPLVFGADVFGRGGSCEACMVSSCAAEGQACADDATCRNRIACITRCSQQAYFSPTCYDACVGDYPGDGALDGVLLSCAAISCRAECGIGGDFRCVGQYAWPTPAPTATSVNVSMQIVGANVNTPVARNASVIACAADDVRCEFSSDRTVKVDGDGFVTFSVPTVSSFGTREPWRGFVRLEEEQTKQDPVAPTLFFQSRREYRDRPAFQAPFAKAQEISLAYDLALRPNPVRTPDRTKGTVTGAIYECRSLPGFFAAGVTVSAEGLDVAPIYISGKTPDASLKATDNTGAFFFPNVPPATYVFSFKRDGVEIARESMIVKAGTVTVLGIWPRTK